MAADSVNVISFVNYESIASNYANLRSHLTIASSYLYTAVYTIVTLSDFDPTLDLLQSFYDVYTTQRKALLDNTPFVPAVRALNQHILQRGTNAAGAPWATLNDWFGYHAVTVPQAWIDMSTTAGFTISTVYAVG